MKKFALNKVWRKTSQCLLPDLRPLPINGNYDIYPSFKLDDNQIFEGFEALAGLFIKHSIIIVDGYAGVFYGHFREKLDGYLKKQGVRTSWRYTSDFFKPEKIIDEMISPFLGGDDPLFGKRTDLILEDFFDLPLLNNVAPDPEADINILVGPGASLSGWKGLKVYIDIPKNEIQFRSRAESITNLGASVPSDPKEMYKRFYFID